MAFVSSATNLVSGPTNSNFNIYLRDLEAGTNSLVSVASDGVTPGNGDSSNPAMSEDGRYVVFDSYASNLAAGGLSGIYPNLYLRDLKAGTTTLLTNSALPGVIPSISADGRYVAYLFGATPQLVVHDTQLGTDVFGTNTAAFAVVSPSGGRLLMLNSSLTVLSVINLTNQATLFTFSSTARIQFYEPWSSDGRYFTFVTSKRPLRLTTTPPTISISTTFKPQR